MITLSPRVSGQCGRAAFPALATPLFGNRDRLEATLKAKRLAAACLEAAWVNAAEAAIAHGLPRAIQIGDRATWDRITWHRYLDAATAREPEFKSRIMRLYAEIDNLEKLLATPPMARAA